MIFQRLGKNKFNYGGSDDYERKTNDYDPSRYDVLRAGLPQPRIHVLETLCYS